MKQEEVPTSWVLRTHFSRAIYYRSDSCIDASWLDVPRKPIGTLAGRSVDKSRQREKGLVFIASAPSLDAFYQASLQPSERINHEDSIEGEDCSFSFPSVIACASRVCDSPPLNLIKDTSCLFVSSDEELGVSPETTESTHSLQSTSDGSLSTTAPRRSFSLNNLLRQQEGMQICTSKASSLKRSASKCSVWESPSGSPPKGSPNNSQQNSPRYKSDSTKSLNVNSPSSSKKVSKGASAKSDVMTRALSWSDHLSHAIGNERAVLSAQNWMIDLSQLLLGERFASGNYSRIYHGMYQDTPVAVKIIRQPDEEESLADRLEKVFMQEVTTLSCLQHQNVVKFIAACKKPPVLCVITEYVPGGSLRAFLHKREGELLPISQVVQMALDIAYGMEYLHMKGVVHRDLKSENLVLGENGCIKILDFGVSCFESDCNSDVHDLGTYRWMAPEMLSQKPYTRKVDVYSYGIVLWELLTAHLPYEEMGAVQAAFCVIHQNTRPPIPADCPAFLRDLMCQCWSTEPEDRPEFWEILRVINMCI